MVDEGADDTAIEFSRIRGLSRDAHQPHQMNTLIMASSDLILMMDGRQMERLKFFAFASLRSISAVKA